MTDSDSYTRPRKARTRLLSFAQDATLISLSAFFAAAHIRAIGEGRWTSIGFGVEQVLLVLMFLSRRRSRATSTRPIDWLFAAGGWLPILMRPDAASGGPALAGAILQAGGLLMTCAGFIALGRSFGVVAANRGLKVSGPYRFVRHPIYLSHSVTMVGFLVANPSVLNSALLVITTACQLMRIRAEERVLTETADYAEYRARVRWRLVPGLY